MSPGDLDVALGVGLTAGREASRGRARPSHRVRPWCPGASGGFRTEPGEVPGTSSENGFVEEHLGGESRIEACGSRGALSSAAHRSVRRATARARPASHAPFMNTNASPRPDRSRSWIVTIRARDLGLEVPVYPEEGQSHESSTWFLLWSFGGRERLNSRPNRLRTPETLEEARTHRPPLGAHPRPGPRRSSLTTRELALVRDEAAPGSAR